MAYGSAASQFLSAVTLFVGISVGLLANIAVLILLIKIERNGIRSVLIQLALADILLLAGPSVIEIWTQNEGSFVFGKTACIAYQGLEVFGSTSMLYFTVTVGLQALSFLRKKRRYFEDDGEVESSRRSLVGGGDASTPPRNMALSGPEMHTDVSDIRPILTIWILSASLSIPKAAMASLISIGDNKFLCTFSEPTHKMTVSLLLNIFEVILPVTLLAITGLITIVHVCKQKPSKNSKTKSYLLLFLFIFLIYILFCLPRASLVLYHIFYPSSIQDGSPSPDPLFTDGKEPKHMCLLFAYLYYLSCLLRPMICLATLPQLRTVFKKNDE